MIDPKLLRTDPDRIRNSQKLRGESLENVDAVLLADEARRTAINSYESVRAQQKELGKSVATAQGEAKQAILAQTKELSARVKELEAAAHEADASYLSAMKKLGNLVIDGVPAGGEDDGVVIDTHGTPRDFAAEGFTPRDHLELGEMLGAIDMERGTKVSGSRFYILKGSGAKLEFALLNLAMSMAYKWGFTPIIPPALVKPSAMEGTGFLDQTSENDEVYSLPKDDLLLVGTSEVALAGMHADEILDGAALPFQYVGYSPCFRREAGSYGKDTRGIFRVHWFDKVEMFVYCDPAEAEQWHEKLLGFEREFIEALEIPYQVLDVAAGDLGLSAARKFDCYGWVPTQGKYREITSTSNCTEFQSRRLNIRQRISGEVKPVATLNGTLCSMARPIVMILENHQQADGSVRIPEALQPFMGCSVIEPVKK